MVRACCFKNCSSRSHDRKGQKLDNEFRFFNFPTWKRSVGPQVEEISKRRRMAWVAAVRRKDITFAQISPFMFVCSRHFHMGKPAYEMMETDPDWAPSLHLGHTEITQTNIARFARQGKRQQQKRNSLQTAEMNAYQSDDNNQHHTEEEAHVESGQVCTEGDPGESGQENTAHNTSQDVADAECNLCLLRRSEVNRLLEENGALQRELDESRMSDSFFGDDDDKVKYYTGLPGKRYTFQQTISSSAEHCCVPLCTASSKYNSALSFHTFPTDLETRRKWIAAIRRDHFVVSPHTRVCSRHFTKEDVREPGSETGRRLLRKGAVPALSEWNNFSLPLSRPGVLERRERPAEEDTSREEAASITNDHDYAAAPVVHLAIDENKALRSEIDQLRKQVHTLHLKQRFGLHRFSGSDRDVRFFTRFGSYDLLMRFWTLIEPAVPSMVSVTQAQRDSFTESTLPATHSLQPIDEMFMFLNYLALGLKQRDLADRYGVHQSTVSRIITTWSHFLYTVLGSVRTWIPEEKIRESLPAEFKDYADTTVILDCIELRCQCPTSPLLQSKVFSAHKSHCTLKGLLGVAPHGAVTFISPLFAGSISDKQITRESGILSLLKPGMAIMVDRGFLVDDFVPCKIHRPAFLSGRSQMPACEVRETQAIARLRVHVERLIRRVKEHKFFDTKIPLWLFGNINQLYTVACLLTNYENGPLVKSWSKKTE